MNDKILYSVKEISAITGLDPKWINDYEDVIPGDNNYKDMKEIKSWGRSKNPIEVKAHKKYKKESLVKFIFVSMLTDLGMKRSDIKEFIKSKNYDESKALNLVIKEAEKQVRKYENIKLVAEYLRIAGGFKDAYMNLFKIQGVDSLADSIRKQKESDYGKQVEEFFNNITDEQSKMFGEMITKLIKLKKYDVESKQVEKQITESIKTINDKFNLNGIKFAANFAFNIISGNGELANILNKKYGSDVSDFISTSILYYLYKPLVKDFEKIVNDEDYDIENEEKVNKDIYDLIDEAYKLTEIYFEDQALIIAKGIPELIRSVNIVDKNEIDKEDIEIQNRILGILNNYIEIIEKEEDKNV